MFAIVLKTFDTENLISGKNTKKTVFCKIDLSHIQNQGLPVFFPVDFWYQLLKKYERPRLEGKGASGTQGKKAKSEFSGFQKILAKKPWTQKISDLSGKTIADFFHCETMALAVTARELSASEKQMSWKFAKKWKHSL